MSESQKTYFAFGADQTVDEVTAKECDCPASAAGYDPKRMETVIHEYDRLVAIEQSVEAGIVDEETAKETWLHMIRSMSDWEVEFVGSMREPLEDACRVARKLGWLGGLDD